MTLARIRKGDQVVVISGKDKGKTGKVLRVMPELDRVLVEKLNMVKKHQRPTAAVREGGIFEREAPLHISKVMPLDPETGKGVRVRTKVEADGSKVRVSAKTGKPLAEPAVDKD